MTNEWNEQLPVQVSNSAEMQRDSAQVERIESHGQMIHLMNEFDAKHIASNRMQFTPIVPAPLLPENIWHDSCWLGNGGVGATGCNKQPPTAGVLPPGTPPVLT